MVGRQADIFFDCCFHSVLCNEILQLNRLCILRIFIAQGARRALEQPSIVQSQLFALDCRSENAVVRRKLANRLAGNARNRVADARRRIPLENHNLHVRFQTFM